MIGVCESVGRFVAFFFFSSRRRHTRCLSDWSSDVCSSDLWVCQVPQLSWPALVFSGLFAMQSQRSEERRVGKECRSRWSRQHENKKQKQIHSRRPGRRRRHATVRETAGSRSHASRREARIY